MWGLVSDLFTGKEDEREKTFINKFTADNNTPPKYLYPDLVFPGVKDYSLFTLKCSEVFEVAISAQESNAIENKTFLHNINDSIYNMCVNFGMGKVYLKISGLLYGVNIVSNILSNKKSKDKVNVVNGLYYVVVALYESSDGKQVIVTKTYSQMDSSYNHDWMWHGAYSGNGLYSYAQKKTSLPIKYYH